MSRKGGKQKAIRLVVNNSPVHCDTVEFIARTSDFTKGDCVAFERFLECLIDVSNKKGPAAAMAVLDRASFPKPVRLAYAKSAAPA